MMETLIIQQFAHVGEKFHMAAFRAYFVDGLNIGLQSTLVELGMLANVKAGPAGTFFCAAVVITMFAAMSFDTRLIWDAKEEK